MIDCAEVSIGNGEMSRLWEGLSAVTPTPRPSHSNHGVLGSGIQTRRHRATVDAVGTNEGEGAPKKKKKKR